MVVTGGKDSGHTEIYQLDVAIFAQHDVLELEITMNDVSLVQLSYAQHDLSDVELDNDLVKFLIFAQVGIHVATRDVRHDEVETGVGLEEVLHPAKVLVLRLEHNAQLVESALDLVSVDKFVFSDALDRVETIR